MFNLISYNFDYNKTNIKGKQLYKNNDFLKSLVNIMENSEFKNFVSLYVKDWSDFKIIMLYIKLYEIIEQKGYFTVYQKLYILQKIFEDKNLRKEAINKFIL